MSNNNKRCRRAGTNEIVARHARESLDTASVVLFVHIFYFFHTEKEYGRYMEKDVEIVIENENFENDIIANIDLKNKTHADTRLKIFV